VTGGTRDRWYPNTGSFHNELKTMEHGTPAYKEREKFVHKALHDMDPNGIETFMRVDQAMRM
jgi:hypothetical protein